MKKLEMGLEIPQAHLETLGELTDFDFILAPVVLTHKAYREYYVSQNQKGRKSMLDNGMWEAGGKPPMTLEDLCVVIGMVQPTEVIVPDVFGDPKKTIENAIEWMKMQDWHPVLRDCSFQFVVQGKNFNEALDCYRYLLEKSLEQNEKAWAKDKEVKPVRTIAFPLGVGCEHDKKDVWAPMREAIVANLSLHKEYDDSIKIHLMSIVDPVEISKYLKMPGMPIQSFDTGAPIRLAKAGKRYNTLTGKGERVEGYLDADEELTLEAFNIAVHNIGVLRKWTIVGA
jgi:hypothetical protein